jgi:peptide deformylase
MNTQDVALPVPPTPDAPKMFVYDTAKPETIVKKKQELLTLYNDKNPMLAQKQPLFDVQNPPCNIIDFANQMLYTMAHYGGVGLAAPQCGFPYRMFVMIGGIVCINPVILHYSKETTFTKEGCLSFPGLYLPVTRPETITISYTNEFGNRVEHTWAGATARVAQHEFDHLEGVNFTTRVGNLTLSMAKKKRQKLMRKISRVVQMKEQHLKATGRAASYKPQNHIPATEIQTHREG